MLLPEYNILKEPGNSSGYTHTEEAISKMKTAWDLRGRVQSAETPVDSKIKREKFGWKHSEETKTKIKKTLLGLKGTVVEVKDMDTSITVEYPSLRQAALHLKTTRTTLRNYIKNNQIFNNKYSVNYKRKNQ